MRTLELVSKLNRKELKPTEITRKYLEKIKKLDSQLNAFLTLNDKAIEEAKNIENSEKSDQPLSGLPIAVKDNEETEGIKTTYGSKLYEKNIPKQNSTLVKKLKNAGAITLGKTNLPEFGLIAYTDNEISGPTKNPWDLTRTPGGSSGGSAAAVAAGMAPIATGTDAGGSIRIPASFCNLYGLKPSFGRISTHPRKPIFTGLHSKGFLTKYVEDTALLLDITKGRDSKDMYSLPDEGVSYLKELENSQTSESTTVYEIAYSPDLGYARIEPEIEKIVQTAAFELEKTHHVEKVGINAPDLEEDLRKKISAELKTMLGEKLEEWKQKAYPPLLGFLKLAESLELKEYVKIKNRKKQLWDSLRPVFGKYDFLITPTVSVPPFKLGSIDVDEINGEKVSDLGWMPFTYPFNFTGQPAASIPAGFTETDLPVGMQIVGKHFDDLGVLKISKEYQNILGWQEKQPEF